MWIPLLDPDERSPLIGNTDGNLDGGWDVDEDGDGDGDRDGYSDRCRFDPVLPLFLYPPPFVSSSLGHPRKIMAPDKTRGTLSKGAYIYETFGKQMDKSNISEAERRSSLRTPDVFPRIPPSNAGLTSASSRIKTFCVNGWQIDQLQEATIDLTTIDHRSLSCCTPNSD